MAYKRFFSIGTGIIFIPLFIYLISSTTPDNQEHIYATDIDRNILEANPDKDFGIVVDSFYVESDRVRWNQQISGILSNYNLVGHSVHNVV